MNTHPSYGNAPSTTGNEHEDQHRKTEQHREQELETMNQTDLWGHNHTPCHHGRTHHCPYCPTPQARTTDPDTSHHAAQTITPNTANTIRHLVHDAIKQHGPITDEQLATIFTANHWPGTPSGIRTRRNELTTAELIIRHPTNGTTTSGRQAAQWTTP
jgi:hypothetical protein